MVEPLLRAMAPLETIWMVVSKPLKVDDWPSNPENAGLKLRWKPGPNKAHCSRLTSSEPGNPPNGFGPLVTPDR